jgi:hypothetical protein
VWIETLVALSKPQRLFGAGVDFRSRTDWVEPDNYVLGVRGLGLVLLLHNFDPGSDSHILAPSQERTTQHRRKQNQLNPSVLSLSQNSTPIIKLT